MHRYSQLLTYIAKKRGLFSELKTSTIGIAKELNVSQQTISRQLREMESLQLIKRTATAKGLTIAIDEKGREFLKQDFEALKGIFTGKTELTGTVEKGIGEGAYYVSLPQYQSQFKNKLGFKAFPGTLNIKTEESREFIANLMPIKINGFTTKQRTFGSLTAYKIRINNIKVKAALIIPERTRHEENIIEIIAPINLKQRLKLKDGNKIKIIK